MEVLSEGNKDYVYSGRFTGTVQLEMLAEAQIETEADVARVHSFDGAVTKWHSHPGGQNLILLSGLARAGDENGDYRELVPGTFIRTQPNESHWHGAEEGQDCVWLAITYGVTAWTDDIPHCCT